MREMKNIVKEITNRYGESMNSLFSIKVEACNHFHELHTVEDALNIKAYELFLHPLLALITPTDNEE